MNQLKFLISEPRKALFGQLTIYYLIIAGILYTLLLLIGDIIGRPNIPIEEGVDLGRTIWQTARWEPTAENLIFLLYSLSHVVLLTVPMTWVYRGTRRKRDLDQSIVETVLILPIIVAGIIMIVQSNLALAFSLAGIFAGVQFRSRLKEIADAHYLFASIGIALASGVGAWHIAFVLSVFFCFGVYAFWRIGYANDSGDRHTRIPGGKHGHDADYEADHEIGNDEQDPLSDEAGQEPASGGTPPRHNQ